MKFILPISKKEILIEAMRMKEEKILTDKKMLKAGSNIDNLLISCITSIDGEKPTEKKILDMLSGDRSYLLYHLRIMSYGSEYETDENCPYCKKNTHYVFDLENLIEDGKIKITGEPEGGLEKNITVSDGSIVTVTALDGHRERRLKTKGENITTMDMTLALMKAINGETVTTSAMEKWIGKDLKAIRHAGGELTGGLIPAVKVECEHCDREHDLVLTASASFFIQ